MVRVHAYRDAVRSCLYNLDALNHRLSRHVHDGFIDKVSATNLKDNLTSGEIRTAISNRVAQFKGQSLLISILDDTNDPRAFQMNVGQVGAHAA